MNPIFDNIGIEIYYDDHICCKFCSNVYLKLNALLFSISPHQEWEMESTPCQKWHEKSYMRVNHNTINR